MTGTAAPPQSWLGQLGDATLFTLNEVAVTPYAILRVLAIVAAAWVVSWLARRALTRFERTRGGALRPAFYAVGRVVHYLLLVAGLMIALGSIGLDLTELTLFVSALGVGLGFGMQSVVSNFISGLIILFERHLKVGDFVELESGVTGEVREINIRATRITTNDNIDVLVPNSEFVNGRVINWTLDDVSRRIHVKFAVAYGADKSRVRESVLQAALALPFTRSDADRIRPQVWLQGFGESALEFELVVWLTPDAVKRPGAVHAAYCWAVDDALRAAGIEIPFPQRDLHIRTLFGLSGAEARGLAFGDAGAEPAEQAPPPPARNDALTDAMQPTPRVESETPASGTT